MTGQEVNALAPEEVNKEVIKRIMGGKKADYVNSFDAAWRIVDKMKVFDLAEAEDDKFGNTSVWHHFELELRYQLVPDSRSDEGRKKVFALSPVQLLRNLNPLAICRAGLNVCWAFGGENNYRYPKNEEAINKALARHN